MVKSIRDLYIHLKALLLALMDSRTSRPSHQEPHLTGQSQKSTRSDTIKDSDQSLNEETSIAKSILDQFDYRNNEFWIVNTDPSRPTFMFVDRMEGIFLEAYTLDRQDLAEELIRERLEIYPAARPYKVNWSYIMQVIAHSGFRNGAFCTGVRINNQFIWDARPPKIDVQNKSL